MSLRKKNRLVASAVLAFLVSSPGWALQETPVTYSSINDSFAAVVIGDVKGLVQGLSDLVNRVVPGMGAMIPMQVGGFLGDPSLAGFAPGSGLAVIIFPGGQMVGVAEIEEAERESYVQTAKERGDLAATVGGLVVFSPDEAGLATANAVATEVQDALLNDPAKATLHALVHVPKILSTYQKEIDEGLAALPQMMEADMSKAASQPVDAKGAIKILQAEILGLHHLASQIEIFEAELDPAAGGLLLELTFMPLQGTPLATLLATAQGGKDINLIRMLPPGGGMRIEASYDNRAVGTFLTGEADALFEKVDWGQEEEAMRKWFDKTQDFYGDGWASTTLAEGDTPFGNVYIAKSDDPQKTHNAFRDMMTEMGSSGILDFYKAAGVDMTFDYKEKTREYKGVQVDSLDMKMDFPGAETMKMAEFFKKFAQFDYEMAMVDDFFVNSMNGPTLDGVIDRIQGNGASPAPPLVSKQELGAGGAVYTDLDLEGYAKMVTSVLTGLPEEEEGPKMSEYLPLVEKALAPLAGAPPIMMGLFGETDQAKFKLKIPSGLIEKISAVVNTFMPQGPNGG